MGISSRRPGPRSGGVGRTPLLSVVVPAYDVEAYLTECLDSILTQSYPHLEVVVVDDGSTDTTGDLAEQVAEQDSRVRVVHQANGGLGAARNAGVAVASGDLLAFADSDDVVCPGAYEMLVGSLERTGSDLAVGSVERCGAVAGHSLPLVRENHRRPLTRVAIDDAPLMLADCFAWNKVFRRSFWERAAVSFPEGVRYEDQPAVTRALIEAERFDSLPDPVYRWRVRADGTSISQRRGEVADLSDRIATKRWSTQLVRARTSARTQVDWYGRILPVDMWEYFRAVPGCTDEYWALLRAGLAEFWGPQTIAFELTRIPLRQRLMGWLVAEDRRADLVDFLGYLDRHGGRLPRNVVDGTVRVTHPFVRLAGLPPALASA